MTIFMTIFMTASMFPSNTLDMANCSLSRQFPISYTVLYLESGICYGDILKV